jgi:hypothetical protein
MAGGKEVATDDPEVRKAAEFAVGQLAAQSNSLVPPQLKEVHSHLQQASDPLPRDLLMRA